MLLCLYQSHQLQIRGCVVMVGWTKRRNAMQVMRVTNAATKIVNSGSKSKVKFNVGEWMFNVQISTWHLQFVSLNAIISFHKVIMYMYFIHLKTVIIMNLTSGFTSLFSPMNYACCVNCTVAPRGYPCLDRVDDNFDCKGRSTCKYPLLKW